MSGWRPRTVGPSNNPVLPLRCEQASKGHHVYAADEHGELLPRCSNPRTIIDHIQCASDDDASTNIAVEIDFSNYQLVNGILVPFHITKVWQGNPLLDFTVTNMAVNSGLPDSLFSFSDRTEPTCEESTLSSCLLGIRAITWYSIWSSGHWNAAFGSFGGGPFDTVNLGNLNVHFAIPVFNKAGRGTPFSYSWGYDSSVWYPVTSNGVTSWVHLSNWGWAVG